MILSCGKELNPLLKNDHLVHSNTWAIEFARYLSNDERNRLL